MANFHARILPLTGVALLLSSCSGSDRPPPPDEPAPAESTRGRGRVEARFPQAEVSLEYGRPELTPEGFIRDTRETPSEMRAGRETGFVWRLGRNEATTLTTSTPLRFGDLQLEAGRYALFARKEGAGRWSLVFNAEPDQWGSFDYDPEQDIAAVPLQVLANNEAVRSFTVLLSSSGIEGRLEFQWGTDRLAVDFVTPR